MFTPAIAKSAVNGVYTNHKKVCWMEGEGGPKIGGLD